jgi:hypothetical protein
MNNDVSEVHAAPVFRAEVSKMRKLADSTGRLQDGGESGGQINKIGPSAL